MATRKDSFVPGDAEILPVQLPRRQALSVFVRRLAVLLLIFGITVGAIAVVLAFGSLPSAGASLAPAVLAGTGLVIAVYGLRALLRRAAPASANAPGGVIDLADLAESPPDLRGATDAVFSTAVRAGGRSSAYRSITILLGLLVVVVSAVGWLTPLFGGFRREVPAILGGIGGFFLLSLLTYFAMLSFRARRRAASETLVHASRQLELAHARHEYYVTTLDRIIDREVRTFHDTLEMTMHVGSDDDGDVVLERWATEPQPLMTHHALHMLIPSDARDTYFDAFDLRLRADGSTIVGMLPLPSETGRGRVCAVFDPPVADPIEWSAEYRPHGIWRPLRERGWQLLEWKDESGSAVDGSPALTQLTVRFVFPASNKPPVVTERHGYGSVGHTSALQDRSWLVEWRDSEPNRRTYQWDVSHHLRHEW